MVQALVALVVALSLATLDLVSTPAPEARPIAVEEPAPAVAEGHTGH